MKLDDIIALAKQGYKPADIKELIALSVPEEVSDAPNSTETSQPDTGNDAEDNTLESKTAADTKDTEPDYKALYEKSQEDLKKAQSVNVNQNVVPDNQPSIDDQLQEMMENLLR